MQSKYVLFELIKYNKSGVIEASTSSLSKHLGLSQQSVSRKLIELEKLGLVKRQANAKGTTIFLNQKSKDFLAEQYAVLKNFFEKGKSTIKGSVKTGLGEGKYYMSQLEYEQQFFEKLGFKPYPGTLNLRVNPSEATLFLQGLESFRINGFTRKERTFGALSSYRIVIKGIHAAVIVPDRTAHDRTTLEVIAPLYLRQQLKLKDGDSISLEAL